MQAGKAIYSLLSSVESDIYPVNIPQGVKGNKIVYNVISATPSDRKDGTSAVDTLRVQVSVYTGRYDDGIVLAESVRSALDNYTGTTGGVAVDRIRFESEQHTYNLDTDQYGVITDYMMRLK